MIDNPTVSSTIIPRAAATTLIVRDGAGGLEVLMVRRSLQASFMPGAHVFPGGAVDILDDSIAHRSACDESFEQLSSRIGSLTRVGNRAFAYAIAALRECFEECGLWLGASDDDRSTDWTELRRRLHAGEPFAALASEAGIRLATSALQPWSHWVTPAGIPKRFDTLFFVAIAPVNQVPSVDAGETTALAWVRPSEALAASARGEFQMEFATLRTMESLLPFSAGKAAALLAHAENFADLPPVHPRIRRSVDGKIIGVVLPGRPGYDELA